MARNDSVAVAKLNESIDVLNMNIFRSLRRPTFSLAFSAGGASISELTSICAPGRPHVSVATAMLTILVAQVPLYFSVGKSMDKYQVAMAVDDIIERFSYMSLEEVATAFAIGRRTAAIYDRMDPNIIMSWLYKYDAERDGLCEAEAQKHSEEGALSSLGVSFAKYKSDLERRVAAGDPEALKEKAYYDEIEQRNRADTLSEAAFEAWRKEHNV